MRNKQIQTQTNIPYCNAWARYTKKSICTANALSFHAHIYSRISPFADRFFWFVCISFVIISPHLHFMFVLYCIHQQAAAATEMCRFVWCWCRCCGCCCYYCYCCYHSHRIQSSYWNPACSNESNLAWLLLLLFLSILLIRTIQCSMSEFCFIKNKSHTHLYAHVRGRGERKAPHIHTYKKTHTNPIRYTFHILIRLQSSPIFNRASVYIEQQSSQRFKFQFHFYWPKIENDRITRK